jgi:hypothetical protein
MKTFFSVSLFIILMIYATTTARGATFKGKVIDADTKQPIEGAVVVTSWIEERMTVTGGGQRTKDVKETLTDKDGKWEIRGPRGDGITKWFALIPGVYYTHSPEFIVFKPGYCSYPKGFGIASCKGKIKTYNNGTSENIGEIVELPKLIDREDRKRSLPDPIHPDAEKNFYSAQRAFIGLINEESRNLGLGEYDTLRRYEK